VGGSSAEFDAEKVARISQAIADGSFKVNHAAIADKLITNAAELLTKSSHCRRPYTRRRATVL
jgi:negative regulator of flagellin synthesis FlgM